MKNIKNRKSADNWHSATKPLKIKMFARFNKVECKIAKLFL